MKALIIVSLSFILLTISGCKKKCFDATDPECENYDPCIAAKPVADFRIREFNGWPDIPGYLPEYSDTLLPRGAQFEAMFEKKGTYSWKIANDPRTFSGTQVKLLFDNYINDSNNLANDLYYKPLTITMQLRNNLSDCISASDTLLTKTRQLVITKNYKRKQGRFRGRFDIDGVERVVEIKGDDCWDEKAAHGGDFNYYGCCFLNFPLDDSLKISTRIYGSSLKLSSYKQIAWDSPYTTYNALLDGISKWHLYLEPAPDNRDNITIEYTHILKDNSVHKIKFTGKREL